MRCSDVERRRNTAGPRRDLWQRVGRLRLARRSPFVFRGVRRARAGRPVCRDRPGFYGSAGPYAFSFSTFSLPATRSRALR